MERRLTSRNVSLEWFERGCEEGSNISIDSIQDTYARLKIRHAENMCQNWVEEVESPNQVFEQLSLAACLIELWRSMYGVVPAKEEGLLPESTKSFPGFVDIACGTGILVYVLLMEGYKGSGFDACQRKSWATFPPEVRKCLQERIFIPRPFWDVLEPRDIGVEMHAGDFPRNTFIISDHADELTVWTPIMAALSDPVSPLPFFVIPCCSRSLAGSSYRYPPPKVDVNAMQTSGDSGTTATKVEDSREQNAQPASGDLRALRAIKMKERTESGFLSSMIGSLAAKTMAIAEEVGFDVEKTWLRTPGGVNMALIGGRQQVTENWIKKSGIGDCPTIECPRDALLKQILEIVERECVKDGGIQMAAKLWVERTKILRQGHGEVHQAS